jgi:hypothetical protein
MPRQIGRGSSGVVVSLCGECSFAGIAVLAVCLLIPGVHAHEGHGYIALEPPALRVQPGAAASGLVVVEAGHPIGNGAVVISLIGVPSGLVGACQPRIIPDNGQCRPTIGAEANAAPGNHWLIVRASGSFGAMQVPLALEVVGDEGRFSILAAYGALAILGAMVLAFVGRRRLPPNS